MVFAEVEVSGVCAHVTRKRLIPAGIIGVQVSFVFRDPKWDSLTRTAVFKGYGVKHVEIKDGIARIPQEIVSRKGVRLRVGIYGTDAQKVIAIPTLWADLGEIRDAADPSADPAMDPELPMWAELREKVRQLEEEGIKIDPSSVEQAVEDYLQSNPDLISELPQITEKAEGKYLRVKNGVAVWGDLEIPQQYGLVTYDQTRTITIT